MKAFGAVVCCSFLLALVLTAQSTPLPDGEGKAEIEKSCNTQCHGTAVWSGSKRTPAQWKSVVSEMVGMGADLTAEEEAAVVGYLSRHFAATVNVNTAAAKQIAETLELTADQAAAIVAHRETNGKFATWQDVAKVPGLPAKAIEEKKDRLVF
jgi:competence protein ComEA